MSDLDKWKMLYFGHIDLTKVEQDIFDSMYAPKFFKFKDK